MQNDETPTASEPQAPNPKVEEAKKRAEDASDLADEALDRADHLGEDAEGKKDG